MGHFGRDALDDGSGSSLQAPAELAAEEVHGILRQVVGMVLNGAPCEGLQRFPALQREIAGTAAGALAATRSDVFWKSVCPGLATAYCCRICTEWICLHCVLSLSVGNAAETLKASILVSM